MPVERIRILRSQKLIEGRRPNYSVSAQVAKATGDKAMYMKNLPLDNQF